MKTSAEQCLELHRRLGDQLNDREAILAERRRQIEAEGWTPEHDDQWVNGEIAKAASSYAEFMADPRRRPSWWSCPLLWPWADAWWKPSDHRRNLVKAGALILAEIERLDRAAAAQAGGE